MMFTVSSATRAACLLVWLSSRIMANAYMDATTYSTAGKTMAVKRDNHVDHWNSDTLAYYLDGGGDDGVPSDTPDAVVMFYATWDRNSHRLAPYWGDIATKLGAGRTDGRGGNGLVAQFLVHDILSGVGRRIPIWGGKDTLLEHRFNALARIVTRA